MDPYWTANLGPERGGRARNTLLKLAGRGQMLVILTVLIPVLLGMLASEVSTPTVAADSLSISVTLSRSVPYYFGRVLGLTASPVVVTATAGLFTTGSVTGSMPIGL